MKVAIAGGGTAGHVTPGIALARTLAADGHEAFFIGTQRGIEAKLVPAAGFGLETLPVTGFDRSRPWSVLPAGARAIAATSTVRELLAREGAEAVVGMGGYVSVPAVWAASRSSISVVLHEQNIVLGLAHRLTKRAADAVAVSFAETLESAGPRAVLTGNPVAQELEAFDREAARRSGLARWDLDPAKKTVLIFGGSLGARTINEAAPAMGRAWAERQDVQLLHIVGTSSDGAATADTAVYRSIRWAENMSEAYGVADIAICRAGATTIAELCATGTPSILVPYPHHRDRQQERHAEVIEAAGGAITVPDGEADSSRLGAIVDELLTSPGKLTTMAGASRSQAKPHAASELARLVLSHARG